MIKEEENEDDRQKVNITQNNMKANLAQINMKVNTQNHQILRIIKYSESTNAQNPNAQNQQMLKII